MRHPGTGRPTGMSRCRRTHDAGTLQRAQVFIRHSPLSYMNVTIATSFITEQTAAQLVPRVPVRTVPAPGGGVARAAEDRCGAVGAGRLGGAGVPAFASGIARVGELAARGEGRLVVLQAT